MKRIMLYLIPLFSCLMPTLGGRTLLDDSDTGHNDLEYEGMGADRAAMIKDRKKVAGDMRRAYREAEAKYTR
jgi:hypothetical protein